MREQLQAIIQSGAEADVDVPIRRRVVQVQDEAGTSVGRIVPIAATNRSTLTARFSLAPIQIILSAIFASRLSSCRFR